MMQSCTCYFCRLLLCGVRHSLPEMLAPGFKSSKLQKKSIKSLQYRGQLFSCEVEKVVHTVNLGMIQNMISKLIVWIMSLFWVGIWSTTVPNNWIKLQFVYPTFLFSVKLSSFFTFQQFLSQFPKRWSKYWVLFGQLIWWHMPCPCFCNI